MISALGQPYVTTRRGIVLLGAGWLGRSQPGRGTKHTAIARTLVCDTVLALESVERCRAVVVCVACAGRRGEPAGKWLEMLAEEVERTDSVHYRVVAAALRAAIASGRIPVGARLPPERELARLLGVGRRTIVEAFNLLRAESLIRSRHGAGTWVVRRPEPGAGCCSR